MTSFPLTWATARVARGWLTEEQGLLLWETVLGSPRGATVVEIGSFEGRSTVVLGTAARARDSQVVAIDPFVTDWKFGDPLTRSRFDANVEGAGLGDVVRLVPESSTRVRPGWADRIDVLFIDGKHDYWTVSDDLRWSEHLRPGGSVLVHDCFSSVGVTIAVLTRVLPGSHLAYVRREGSLAVFVARRPGPTDRLRLLAQLPWWCRNVAVKVALRTRLTAVARLLGHEGRYDPY